MKTSITALWLACGLAFSSVSFAQSVTEVGSLSQPTMNHSATLLENGKVLLVALDGRSELFDPATNTWSQTGAMAQGSEKHTATRLANGKVLVTGGFVRNPPTQFGQGSVASVVARSEIFDPATGVWTQTGALPSPLAYHTATKLASGAVIVVGGANLVASGLIPGDSITQFDPVAGLWTAITTLPAPRATHTTSLLANGDLLVLGGFDAAGRATNSCFRFRQSMLSITNCTGMPGVRAQHVATTLSDGRIFVSGGAYAGDAVESIYDPIEDSWAPTAAPSRVSTNHAAVARNSNSVVVWGGGFESFYALGTEQPPLPLPGSRYFVAANEMKPMFAINQTDAPGLAAHTMTSLGDGRTLVAGGFDSYSAYQSLGVFYSPRSSSKTYVIDRQPSTTYLAVTDGLTPYAPAIGERYFLLLQAAGSWNPIAASGTIAVTDGGATCVAALPALGCKLTALTDGPKSYLANYSGDVEYLPSQASQGRPTGSMLRIERWGNRYSHVDFNADASQTIRRGYCGWLFQGGFSFYFENCDVPMSAGASISFSTFPVPTDTFVGWQGACAGTGATCLATMPASGSLVVKAIFAPTASLPLKLDIDNNGAVNAATDGQLIRRFMSRVHDAALTQGALGASPQRNLPDAIEDRLNDMAPLLDVDQNGRTDSATDGLIILRFLLGFRGDALTAGAIGAGARRTDATDIATHLQSLMP